MFPASPDWPGLRTWAWRSAVTALAVLGAGLLGIALPSVTAFVSGFWPAAGVALALMLRWGIGVAPAAWLATWLVERTAGAPPVLAALMALGNTAGPLLAARWLRSAHLNPRLEQRRDLWLLVGAGALGSAVISAANGAAWLAVFGRITAVDLPQVALHWWVGDTLGLFLAGVPLLALGWRSVADALRPGQRWHTLLASGGCIAAIAAVAPPGPLGPAITLLALPPVLLCWLALRGGLGIAAATALLVSALLHLGTSLGWGPFTGPNGLAALSGYQAMLAALVLIAQVQMGELARLEERWQLALDGSDVGVADWQLRTGSHFTSPRWRALMDDPQGEHTATLERWLAQVHADDRGALRSALAPVPSQGSAGLRREARIRVRDAWCWFDVHVIVAERDELGQPVRVVSSLADIGARRNAQDREQLSSSVFMQLHEGLVVTDADLRVLDANPTYCRITGVPREELIGSVPSLLRLGAGDALSRQQHAGLWGALRSQGHWAGEVVERRRNGEACALHVTVSTVHGPEGALRYHVLVVSDVTEQRLQREQLARQAHFDELTKLPNRARLTQLLTEAMAATDRDGYLLAVCYLDLDHFKAINDRHGHEAGDQMLAELANRMRSALRSRGAGWADTAARLGGDEFVLLLRAGTLDEARQAVDRVLQVVSQPLQLRPDSPPDVVTASVGATVYPLDASDADTLLRHADHAMYGVKQSGRNGYLFFDPEHSRRTEERVLAIGRVQDALDRNELMLYFQPKVDLRRGTVLGFEALLRWNHPEHGVVPPAQFLPLIEHTGLSARVGDHVLAQALNQLEAWQAQGLDLSISVNITARHLQEADFAQRLAELLARHPTALGHKLELEVLESAALGDVDLISAVLERCAKLGVRAALDDFGTSFSTLTHLRRLPVQVLKIDRSFVRDMLTNAQDRAIVEGVISLSRTFGCQVVAEGVEGPAQARMLLDMGCDVGQGVGIAWPMPAHEVPAWVRDWKGLFTLTAAQSGGASGVSHGDPALDAPPPSLGTTGP